MELSAKTNESDHKVIKVHGGLSMRLNARTSEKIAFALLSLAALIVAGFVLIILAYIIYYGYSAISVEFLTEMPKRMMTQGGIYPAIVGTLILIVGSRPWPFQWGLWLLSTLTNTQEKTGPPGL